MDLNYKKCKNLKLKLQFSHDNMMITFHDDNMSDVSKIKIERILHFKILHQSYTLDYQEVF